MSLLEHMPQWSEPDLTQVTSEVLFALRLKEAGPYPFDLLRLRDRAQAVLDSGPKAPQLEGKSRRDRVSEEARANWTNLWREILKLHIAGPDKDAPRLMVALTRLPGWREIHDAMAFRIGPDKRRRPVENVSCQTLDGRIAVLPARKPKTIWPHLKPPKMPAKVVDAFERVTGVLSEASAFIAFHEGKHPHGLDWMWSDVYKSIPRRIRRDFLEAWEAMPSHAFTRAMKPQLEAWDGKLLSYCDLKSSSSYLEWGFTFWPRPWPERHEHAATI